MVDALYHPLIPLLVETEGSEEDCEDKREKPPGIVTASA
jgi:hypothetical protein